MKASDLAKLSGVSVRTLHHYDQIGLLCPKRNSENNYRSYGTEEISKLQQILFFKRSGLPLKTIQQLLENPEFDVLEALYIHKKALQYEKEHLEILIQTLDKTIKMQEEGIEMDASSKFVGFDNGKNPYEAEAKQRYGEKVMDESKEKMRAYAEKNGNVMEALEENFLKISTLQNMEPDSEEVQKEIENLFTFFNQAFATYTPEAFAGVGQLYISDEKFNVTMLTFGEDFPAFIAKAMSFFAEQYSE